MDPSILFSKWQEHEKDLKILSNDQEVTRRRGKTLHKKSQTLEIQSKKMKSAKEKLMKT